MQFQRKAPVYFVYNPLTGENIKCNHIEDAKALYLTLLKELAIYYNLSVNEAVSIKEGGAEWRAIDFINKVSLMNG